VDDGRVGGVVPDRVQDDLHQDDDLVMVIHFQAGGWRICRARVGGPQHV